MVLLVQGPDGKTVETLKRRKKMYKGFSATMTKPKETCAKAHRGGMALKPTSCILLSHYPVQH